MKTHLQSTKIAFGTIGVHSSLIYIISERHETSLCVYQSRRRVAFELLLDPRLGSTAFVAVEFVILEYSLR